MKYTTTKISMATGLAALTAVGCGSHSNRLGAGPTITHTVIVTHTAIKPTTSAASPEPSAGSDLPNWLVAIGTLGAFATGGAVLIRELNRDREREAIAERQQASTIAAWPVRTETTIEALTTIKAQLVLNNSSTEPVYNIKIEYLITDTKQTMSDELQILPPGRYERELPRGLQETWIETAEGWIKQGAAVSSPVVTPYAQSWNFTYETSFIDASGRYWRRQADGSLKRQQPIVKPA